MMRLEVAGCVTYAYTGARAFDAAQPTVVFVHGAALDHSVWALQSRYFAHHGSNILALDLPGHGRSEGAPMSSVAALAAWVMAVLDSIGVERATLVGHSLGSLVALDAAGRYPGRVARLAMLAPSVPMPVSDTLLAAARDDVNVAYELITGWSFSEAHKLGGNQQPGVWMTAVALRLMQRCAPGVLNADLLACHEYATGLTAAAAVRCPSLIIVGERDQMAPARNARSLAQALPDVRTITIPRCGHSLMAEAPDAVLDALRAFLLQPSTSPPVHRRGPVEAVNRSERP
jgi:pimeloyl-ACP methyl ester carboxylesterase